ncbi:hypothetical protein HHL16_12690 [Pseudoflavitalea sp. G-6-1-2]|uniref:hypothetical protein n=1 Tax=Pseudoflavitalea sp. G-6-1-2 TaxID=2728841 RepID=UPI00146AB35D|nr:hypothetical protein [Pseudoflavitalea sp. G-6-1-2]NML21740.1 hypothetical protein [Pseudoflavitalea sp. G-6-1-2]
MKAIKTTYLFLLLFIAAFLSCSKSNSDNSAKTYVPVFAILTEGSANDVYAKISYRYNNRNQLSEISMQKNNSITTISYEYSQEGTVSKAIVSSDISTRRYEYDFNYKNQRLGSYSLYSSGSITEVQIIWDPSGKSCTQVVTGTGAKVSFNFSEQGNIIDRTGTGITNVFKVGYGTGKGIFSDFPLQLGHFLPVQENLLELYYGSTMEINSIYINGQANNFVSTYNRSGLLEKAELRPNTNDRFTYTFKYESRVQ